MTGGFRLLNSLADLPATQWDALGGAHLQPCLSHAWLHALEATGSVGGASGWRPRHATLWRGGELVAAMPLYEKTHSYGEYVFDWSWAQAYARHGLAYYPKWLAAVPFTPIPGPRLLGPDAADRRTLLTTVLEMVAASGHSSFHLLFPAADEVPWLAEAGMMLRHGVQFHWHNAGYGDFDAFLACLNHDKRKKIRQERRRAAVHRLQLRWLDGYRCQATP
jgi:predicted N-acyltransferase